MDLDDVLMTVKEADGVAVLTVKDLRDAAGAQRAGSNVMERVSEALNSENHGHLPRRLPTRADQRVVVFNRASRLGMIVYLTVRAIAAEDLIRNYEHLGDTEAAATATTKADDMLKVFTILRNIAAPTGPTEVQPLPANS
ncbi:hypothetical protein ABT300_06875 [Streptomyces sp. NPDC001027]|uniref:hypothetical protein n=1 Tax=Streptomyces sp. NPDC001027 TaxID=3154771 RepID=UPI00332F432B